MAIAVNPEPEPIMSFCRFTRCVEIVAASIGSAALCAGSSIDLAGDWRLALDGGDRMIHAAPASWKFDDRMELPGTTDLAKKGKHVSKARPFEYHLSREWEFTGPAYYARSISIPEDWRGREVVLFLERVMWQSRVWVDGIEASGPHDSLNTPHLHDLGVLEPGAHELVIRVDNRMIHPIGDKGHAYGPQTQSLWNGIVGKIELRSLPATRIDRVRIFPSNDGTLRIEAHGHGCQAIALFELRQRPLFAGHGIPTKACTADHRSEQLLLLPIDNPLHCALRDEHWIEVRGSILFDVAHHLALVARFDEPILQQRVAVWMYQAEFQIGRTLNLLHHPTGNSVTRTVFSVMTAR